MSITEERIELSKAARTVAIGFTSDSRTKDFPLNSMFIQSIAERLAFVGEVTEDLKQFFRIDRQILAFFDRVD